MIVMRLLIRNDGGNRGAGERVAVAQRCHLAFQVPKHDPFHSDRRGGNGAGTQKPGCKTENKAADTA